MRYTLAFILFTGLIVGTCYGRYLSIWYLIYVIYNVFFVCLLNILFLINVASGNDFQDLANKAKAIADCTSKCTSDNQSDLKAIAECTRGCGNGAFSFRANSIVMIAVFFMSNYFVNLVL